MSEWCDVSLGEISSQKKGINYKSEDYADEHSGHPFITIKCFAKGGGYDSTGIKYYGGMVQKADSLNEGNILFSVTDLTRAGDIVGSPLKVPDYGTARLAVASMDCMRVIPNNELCSQDFLYHRLMLSDIRRQMVAYSAGSTVLHLDTKKVPAMKIKIPTDINVQLAVARILNTIDQAIEKTESLIHKYQQIKAGLMQDLFARGVTSDGKLRLPRGQAPELYKETPVGWIPKEWGFDAISSVMESLVDGPFGSNLKTEHYVSDPGVRVVRLQNVQATTYNDNDKAYVSERHALSLVKNKVVSGDILIAGLGEDRYPVGRACQYPSGLPPAINKADCFRLRCKVSGLNDTFIMYFLNTQLAKAQIRRYEQGVTRPRINTGNMKKVVAPIPSLDEQVMIAERLQSIDLHIEQEVILKAKLRENKLGLMHDLLTGIVQVEVHQ